MSSTGYTPASDGSEEEPAAAPQPTWEQPRSELMRPRPDVSAYWQASEQPVWGQPANEQQSWEQPDFTRASPEYISDPAPQGPFPYRQWRAGAPKIRVVPMVLMVVAVAAIVSTIIAAGGMSMPMFFIAFLFLPRLMQFGRRPGPGPRGR